MKNKFSKWLASLLSLVMITISSAPLTMAQATTGTIEGTVTDPQGAVVQNATVTATNKATSFSRSATTNDNGQFSIQQLPAATYEVRVQGAGFKTSVVTDVKVDVGTNQALDVQLQVGGAAEEVNILGSSEAQIDRTDNVVAGVVGTVQIENLPLNGRNFLDLARLQPGAETVDGGAFDPTKANYTGVSLGGQAGRSTQITVDGGSVVDNVVGTTVQNFSQEIVQEFQLGISNTDVSSGASGTGTVNIVSRSGTNEFRGNVFGYFRDSSWAAFPGLDRLDAAHGISADAQAEEIPFDRQQVGGTIGGPIKKDRAFFFFSYERNNQDGASIRNPPPTTRGFAGFTGAPFDEELITGKVDVVINSRHNLLFRYSHNDNQQQNPFPVGRGIVPRESKTGIFGSNDQLNTNRSDGFVTGLTSALTTNVANDFRFNFNDFENKIDAVTKGVPEIRLLEGGSIWRSGNNSITPQTTTQKRYQFKDDLTWVNGSHTWRFGGNYEYTQIGGLIQFFVPGVARILGPTQRDPVLDPNDGAYDTEEDFLNAPVRDIFVGVGDFNLPFNTDAETTNNHRFQVYFNDNWKIKPNFTFNYGVQYRIDSNLWNHDLGRPSIIAPLFGKGTEAAPRDTNNFGPRVGFAWDIGGKGKTVLRGGAGIYYDTTIDNLRVFERADLGPPGTGQFLTQFDVTSDLLPGGDGFFGTTPGSAEGFIRLRDMLPLFGPVRADIESRLAKCKEAVALLCPGAHISGPLFSTEFEVPYSIQYNFGVQRQLPWNLLLQADFNYRKGVHEVLTYDANFSAAVNSHGDFLTKLPNYESSVPYADSSGFSEYKALLVRVDRRFQNGFQFTGSYALSRLNTFGGEGLGLGALLFNPFDFRAQDYGPGALDRTHRLVLSGVWDLPFFKGSSNWAKRNVLGGWNVSFISTMFSGLPTFAELPDFVDIHGGGTFTSYLPGTRFGSIGRDIKTVQELNNLITAYNNNVAVPGATDPQGTPLRDLALLPANAQIGGDSVISQDIRLTKRLRFTENTRLDLSMDVFNVFNVANLTGGLTNVIIPAATAANTANPNLVTTFRPISRTSSIFGTGGPRAFQFGVKFSF
ncbi:MAG TPA: carboxypeptidase regulatory-like domain-containing protein [Pyrinomonadaceae bacterium]|nr:carboxypeptidase regulatory-like domain-containing protein [Pyrinomonadaceae bacterium]